jgi:pimeloyl-ACP methyl ester carboxylesterase
MRSVIVALAMSIACGSAIAQAPADLMYTRPGMLITVGTQHLNFYCMGSGSPTVIMEGGFGDWSPAFSGLQQRVAAFTRTCGYDRAGFGFSDPGPMPRSVDRLAEELHTALHNGGIAGPYLLVGLAFGSGPVRAFADRWMPEVAGMVLINGDAPDLEPPEMTDFWQRLIARQLPQARLCRDWVAAGKPMPIQPPPEYPRLNCYSRVFDGLPDSQFSPELNAVLEEETGKKVVTWDTLISEMEQIPNDTAYLKKHRTSFGSRPVRIITANLFKDSPSTSSANRLEHMRVSYYEALAQANLLDLSSNAKQIFSDTGILVQFEKPELVLQTIREAWEQSK